MKGMVRMIAVGVPVLPVPVTHKLEAHAHGSVF